jgi:exopolysaccharide biosynthesis predicted pyruvyltransferase EpsI
MILSHQLEFEKLGNFLKELTHGRDVHFLLNAGNWGDSLIREGSERFLNGHGIIFKKHRSANDFSRNVFERRRNWRNWFKNYKQSILIYNGCGAFCRYYDRSPLIKSLANRFFKVVILPSTFEQPFKFPDNVIVFSRDKFESLRNVKGSTFCHDMAFSLNLKENAPIYEEGFFYRKDLESISNVFHQEHIDLSSLGDHNTPIDDFVKEIAKYKTIHTDRLHIAITASLLGRNVNLYANNYFKIRAIYHSSLEHHYPNTRFMGPREG